MSDPRSEWLKNVLGFDVEAAARKAVDQATANRTDPRFAPLVEGCLKLDRRLDLARGATGRASQDQRGPVGGLRRVQGGRHGRPAGLGGPKGVWVFMPNGGVARPQHQ